MPTVTKKGIDVSYAQGNIDYNQVKNDGIEFAILRFGYGIGNVDSQFINNVQKCNAIGMSIKGIYHFSYALNVEQAKEEARFVVSGLAGLNLPNIIVFFDFEYDTVDYAKGQGVILGPNECNAHTKAFCEEITNQGYKAGIYFNLDYYTYWYDHNLLNQYVKWLADYSGSADVDCLFHQYSCTGQVAGIYGDVDMNNYFGNDTEEGDEDMDFENMTDAQVDALLARINKRVMALPTSEYAVESSKKAVKSGLFSDGNGDGLIDNPQGTTKRQDLAVVLDRAGVLDQVITIKK